MGRGWFNVSYELLAALLLLPEGTVIENVASAGEPYQFYISVSHPTIPDVGHPVLLHPEIETEVTRVTAFAGWGVALSDALQDLIIEPVAKKLSDIRGSAIELLTELEDPLSEAPSTIRDTAKDTIVQPLGKEFGPNKQAIEFPRDRWED